MLHNKKIEAFTLSEMIVVLIITSIVIGLAFSVLRLVQKQMDGIQQNYNRVTELKKLETSLRLDFNRYSKIRFDAVENNLWFSSEMDSVHYRFDEKNIIKDLDTFQIDLKEKQLFFAAEEALDGRIDAIKLETDKTFQNQILFIFKINDAAAYIN